MDLSYVCQAYSPLPPKYRIYRALMSMGQPQLSYIPAWLKRSRPAWHAKVALGTVRRSTLAEFSLHSSAHCTASSKGSENPVKHTVSQKLHPRSGSAELTLGWSLKKRLTCTLTISAI